MLILLITHLSFTTIKTHTLCNLLLYLNTYFECMSFVFSSLSGCCSPNSLHNSRQNTGVTGPLLNFTQQGHYTLTREVYDMVRKGTFLWGLSISLVVNQTSLWASRRVTLKGHSISYAYHWICDTNEFLMTWNKTCQITCWTLKAGQNNVFNRFLKYDMKICEHLQYESLCNTISGYIRI